MSSRAERGTCPRIIKTRISEFLKTAPQHLKPQGMKSDTPTPHPDPLQLAGQRTRMSGQLEREIMEELYVYYNSCIIILHLIILFI
jgi:hypothetical protein